MAKNILLVGANYEAASFKKPVVTTCFGGAKEFVLDGQTGYVVSPFNKEELAGKILEILGDKEKARQFGEAGFERLRDNFSSEIQVNKLLGWYNKFI